MMKRLFALALMVLLGLQVVEPAFAARRVVVRRGPRRTVVTVHRGWPLRRPMRTVVVRRPTVVVRVAPAHYLAPVVFGGTVVLTRPASDMLVWQDSETLDKGDDWSELTLNADARGTKLWLSIDSGKMQFDWAEVVFENGAARVVDFRDRVLDPGTYPLFDFHDGRAIDHVRFVARSPRGRSQLGLMMES